jgi:hypothetical protein
MQASPARSRWRFRKELPPGHVSQGNSPKCALATLPFVHLSISFEHVQHNLSEREGCASVLKWPPTPSQVGSSDVRGHAPIDH